MKYKLNVKRTTHKLKIFASRYLTLKFWIILASLVAIVASIYGIIYYIKIPKVPNIKVSKNSNYLYTAKNSVYSASFGDRKTNVPKVTFAIGDNEINFTPASGKENNIKVTEKDNKITFEEVYDGVDYIYETKPDRIKEDIVLKKPVEFKVLPFNLDFNGVTPQYISDNLKGKVFYDQNKKYIFHIEKPYAVDANNVRSDNFDFQIKKDLQNGKYVAILNLDYEWLNSTDRKYPITIDPTIVHDTTAEFATGSFDRVKDTGSGSSPVLESYYQELATDVNTLGLYHFNNGVCATDSSGNAYTLTATGGMTCATGGLFDYKASGFAVTPVRYSHTTIMDRALVAGTIEVWINPANLSAVQTILYADSTSDTLLTLGTSGQINLSTSASTNLATANNLVRVSAWTHIAAVWTSVGHKIYINGTEVANDVNTTTHTNQDYTTYIGVGSGGNTLPFSGGIDELRISSVARSAEDIKKSASRRPSAVYTSAAIDLSSVSSWNSLSWTELGVNTGDGETLKDATNLIGQWKFNETSGTTADNAETTAARDLTLTNFDSTASQDANSTSTWTATHKRWGAGALLFDGTDSYAACTDANCGGTSALDPGTRAWTSSAWFKTTKAGAYQTIMGKGQNTGTVDTWWVRITNSNVLDYTVCDGSACVTVSGGKTVTDGVWHYVAVTDDGTTGKIYIDGVLSVTGSTSTIGDIDTAENFEIGAGRSAASRAYYFGGFIDTPCVYARALAESEIVSNYQAGNLELQTRVGASTDPNDGTWEAWRPTTGETAISAMDSDASNWTWDNSSTYMQGVKSDESTIKVEGSGSLKQIIGQPQVDANTTALWHMDETGGTGAYIHDSTSNANHGTPTGTTVVNGPVGKARSFNGSSDVITYSDSSLWRLDGGSNSNQWTISFWLKFNADPSTDIGLIAQQTSATTFWALHLDAGTALRFRYVPSGAATISISNSWNPEANVWYHISVIKNGTTGYSMYVNGTQIGTTQTDVDPLGDLAGSLLIGKYTDTASSIWYLNGIMDEVRVSNLADSVEAIQEAYRLGRDHYLNRTISSTDLSGKTSVPFYIAADRPGTYLQTIAGESSFVNYQTDTNDVGRWHLEEKSGSGAYIKDSSGLGNHLTPTSAVQSIGKIGKGMYFNGSSSLTCTDANCGGTSKLDPNSSNGWSMGAWVNPYSFPATAPTIMSKGFNPGPLMMVNTSGQVRAEMGNSACNNDSGYSYQANATLTANTWNYVVMTVTAANPGVLKIYVNGQLRYTSAASAYYCDSAANFYIGWNGTAGYYWNGLIDEAFASKSTLSDDYIRQSFEVGLRSHPITIDFGAKLDSGNLITGGSDLGFTVDATYYGLNQKGDAIYTGDKIIVKENYDGTEYIAQGTVNAVTASTGAITVVSWDSGSTFPSGGYTINASVFKWQREYWSVNNEALDTHVDAITKLTLRLSDGSEGRTLWIDDLRNNSDYLTTSAGSTITSSAGNRYFQYRTILTSFDEAVTPTLSVLTVDYQSNVAPNTPSLDLPANAAINQLLSPILKTTTTDTDSDYMRYKIELCTDLLMTTNCQTFDQTSSQTGWSGQNAQTSTAYTSGTQGVYTIQTPLSAGTVYYWRSYAKDPGGANTWSSTQGTPYSFRTGYIPNIPSLDEPLNGAIDQLRLPLLKTTTTDTDSDYMKYKIQMCTNSGMTANCQTFDQTSSQTGWSGQNADSGNAYTSGTQAVYTIQSNLDFSTVYYWRSYAKDPIGTNTWSSTQASPYSFTTIVNNIPSLPFDLLSEGETNPMVVIDTTPEFSAICNDADIADSLTKYRIQVDTGTSFTSPLWDSGAGGTVITCTNGTRSPDVSFGGTPLTLNGAIYYWRIKFWDNNGAEGLWSNQNAFFKMDNLADGRPTNCKLSETPTDASLTLSWDDNSNYETQFRIEKNTNGAGYVFLANTAANAVSRVDSAVAQPNTYQYRIRAEGSTNSNWCETSMMTLQLGLFSVKGINLKGLNIR